MLPILGIDKIMRVPPSDEPFKIMHHAPINMPLISVAHKHDFFMLLIVQHGSGIHTIDFENHTVTDYSVFFLAPGQAHQWDLSPDTRGYQILYAPGFLVSGNPDMPFFKPKSVPFLKITHAEYQELENELTRIEKEVTQNFAHAKSIVQNRLLIILLLLKRFYEANPQNTAIEKNSRLIQSFLTLLEKHYRQHSDVAFYAMSMHVTASYLNSVCKKQSGLTAGEQIRDRILLEAKRMLTLTNLDIKEIAYELGFNDTSYFSKFFRKYTRQTPLAFRKRI